MNTPILLLCALAASGCGASRTDLEARLDSLAREVAAQRVAGSTPLHSVDAGGDLPAVCGGRLLDSSVPPDTAFPFSVPYKAAAADTKPEDAITIKEVRGTSPELTVGGMYLVRGTYLLGSAPDATLGLWVTATRERDGCARGNGSNTKNVARGRGSFELAVRVPSEGRAHVSFYVAGQVAGGVYFDGRGAAASP